MKEQRVLNVIFNRAGSGSISTKLAIPKKWINEMEISKENPQVIAEFDGNTIEIKKCPK